MKTKRVMKAELERGKAPWLWYERMRFLDGCEAPDESSRGGQTEDEGLDDSNL